MDLPNINSLFENGRCVIEKIKKVYFYHLFPCRFCEELIALPIYQAIIYNSQIPIMEVRFKCNKQNDRVRIRTLKESNNIFLFPTMVIQTINSEIRVAPIWKPIESDHYEIPEEILKLWTCLIK